MARTARSYATRGSEVLPPRSRAGTGEAHPTTVTALTERGAAARTVLTPEREAPVRAALAVILREALETVESGEVSTMLSHRLTVAVRLACELAAKRLEMSPENP